METVKLSELYVLHLDAGNDSNGNPRRAYLIGHPILGWLDAVDEGYEGRGALSNTPYLAAQSIRGLVQPGELSKALTSGLQARISTRIRVAPSFRKAVLNRTLLTNIVTDVVVDY